MGSVGRIVGFVLFAAILEAYASQGPGTTPPPIAKKCEYAVDAFFLQDLSSDAKKRLPQIKAWLPEYVDELLETYPASRMGFAGFIDNPFPDVGFRAYEPHDYCFKMFQGLTSDRTKIEMALDSALPGSGRDGEEAHLVALQQMGLGGYFAKQKFRGDSEVLRLVIIQTDSLFHVAGDLEKELKKHASYWSSPSDQVLFGHVKEMPKFTVKPNNGDSVVQCGQDGSLDFEDYPTNDQVGFALRSAEVAVLFLTTESVTPYYEVYAAELKEKYHILTAVYQVSNDADDIIFQLTDGVDMLTEKACTHTYPASPKPEIAIPLCNEAAALDLYFVQDITASYKNDLPNIVTLIPNVVTNLNKDFVSPRFALSTFDDKPIGLFGSAKSNDDCGRVVVPFAPNTDNISEVQTALKGLAIHSGVDWKEDQLNAMIAAVQSDAGWRWVQQIPVGPKMLPMVRIVVLATDSGYHAAGDASLLAPNTATGKMCLEEDYPSVDQLISLYVSRDIFPVFLVTKDVRPIYEELASKFHAAGHAAITVEISDDSSDIVATVKTGIDTLCRRR